MAGPHNREVPTVEGGNLDNLQAFGQGNQASVSSPKRKIGVLLNQLGAAIQIFRREIDHFGEPGPECPEKLCLHSCTAITSEQETHFGDYQSRNESWRPGRL
jgi:hypothetical protein